MARIASLGSALQDIYLVDGDDFVSETVHQKSILTKLEIGTKVDIDHMVYTVGGGGVNSAVTFARAGHQAFFLGSVGADLPSQIIRNRCQKESISTEFIYESSKNTGCSVILLDATTGERTILTHRGASQDFTKIKPSILEKIKPDWLYVTTLQGDFITLEKFIKKARAIGAKIMFNPGKKELSAPDQLIPLLSRIDILLVNEKEAEILASAITNINPNPAKPKTKLKHYSDLFKPKLHHLLTKINSYATITIITSGKTGGILSYYPEQPQNADTPVIYSFGLYSDVPVLDTTGAGDAFGSGFLAAYASLSQSAKPSSSQSNSPTTEDEIIKYAITFASANSTSAVQHLGANGHLLYFRTTKLKRFSIEKLQQN